MLINYFSLKKRIESCEISKNNSIKIIRDIRKMDPGLKKAFGKWYKSGIIPKEYIEGITFDMLVNSFQMNGFNAFLTLDWLKREPLEAKAALGRAIDTIVVDNEVLKRKKESEQDDTSDIIIDE